MTQTSCTLLSVRWPIPVGSYSSEFAVVGSRSSPKNDRQKIQGVSLPTAPKSLDRLQHSVTPYRTSVSENGWMDASHWHSWTTLYWIFPWHADSLWQFVANEFGLEIQDLGSLDFSFVYV